MFSVKDPVPFNLCLHVSDLSIHLGRMQFLSHQEKLPDNFFMSICRGTGLDTLRMLKTLF